MNLHSLKPNEGSRSRRLRKGRGRASGKGKTCGRGHKGQMSRKGHKHKAGFEGGQMTLIRRLPKRGFNSRQILRYIPVNVASLVKFEAGTEITPELLKAQGLASGRSRGVRILGNGEIDRALTVKAHAFSATAKAKIEAAGGSCEVI